MLRFHREMEDVSGCLALCQETASAASVVGISAKDPGKVAKGKRTPFAQSFTPMLGFLASARKH